MKMCKACVKLMKSHKDTWHQIDFKLSPIKECEAHPVVTNRRVIRALKSVKAFSLEPAGMTIPVGGITNGNPWGAKVLINTGGGHVHQRSLLLKLFDYEAPMIDYLVQEGYLARHKGVRYIDEVIPTTLTVTKAGDELIRQSHLLAEVTNDKSPLTP